MVRRACSPAGAGVNLPNDRPLTDDEVSFAVAEAILHGKLNPGMNLPFAPMNLLEELFGVSGASASGVTRTLNPNLDFRVAECCWRWVGLGFLVPRTGGSNEYGTFQATERGRQFLASFDAAALTVGGLDRRLSESGFAVSEPARFYARLGQDCFLAGHYEASIVMLGAGTESLIDSLVDAVAANVIPGSPPLAKRGVRPSAVQNLTWLAANLTARRGEWTKALTAVGRGSDWLEPLGNLLAGAGQAIRLTRNEFGHPTGIAAGQADALQIVMVYPRFASLCYVACAELR